MMGPPSLAAMSSPSPRLFPTNLHLRLVTGVLCGLTVLYFLGSVSRPHLHTIHQQINGALPPPSLLPSDELQWSENCTTIPTSYLDKLADRFHLEPEFEYAQRSIHFKAQDMRRKSITKLDDTLFPGTKDFEVFNKAHPQEITQCGAPLNVPVPKSSTPASVDASHLIFGISTTFKRLTDPNVAPMQEWAHWLTDGNGNSNGGRLILRLLDATSKEISETHKMMKKVGIDAKVVVADGKKPMAERYMSLLPLLYNDKSRDSRKWMVLCDDDTFFPSMQSLINRLEDFDETQDMYVGTLSEDVGSIQRHGSQAFGGAGVFFTKPLAAKLTKLFPACSTPEKISEADSGWGPQGDILMRKCVYENTDVRLTLLRDLYQMDLTGDASGFYEAGLRPLSLHHFKGGDWTKAPVLIGAQIIRACGEECYLQRFQTQDDYIISNGFSIAQYPNGINFNTQQMERTFGSMTDELGWNLDFMLGPQRKGLRGTGDKGAWEIKDVEVKRDGSVKQTYIRHKDDPRWIMPDGAPMYAHDGVMELIWHP